MTIIKENREFKIYTFSYGSRKQVEVTYTVMYDKAYKVYISLASDEEDYCGRGISYEKEVAIQAALDDYNSKATEEYQIARKRIVIE